MAILLALQWVEEVRPLRAVICSDSSSSLISLNNNKSDGRPDVLIEMQQTLYRIQMMGLSIILVWIPVHIGIKGNELADKCAKEATKRNHIDITVPFSESEIKTTIKYKLKERWQKQWEEERKRKVVIQNSKKSKRDEKHGENPERGNNNIQVMLWSYKIKQYII